jgi:hypothetical protein
MTIRDNNRMLRSDLKTPLRHLQQMRMTWEGEAGKVLLDQLDNIIARLSRVTEGR